MKFIDKKYVYTHEVKQSKFIANLVPYSEYESLLQELKSKHPKARHFVVAYRYLNEFNQIVEHSSDDGEPKGTSGKPSLFVLQGCDIINSAVIIIRYFGGTKLGTGGLVRAYSDAVNLVIDNAEFTEYKEEISMKISFEYTNLRFVEYECQVHGINIMNKSFDSDVFFDIKATKDNLSTFLEKVKRLIIIKKD